MGGLVGGLLEPARDVALERDRLADLVRSSASRSLASASRISASLIGYRRTHLSSNVHGRLSLHTATMLDTIVMICVRFSFRFGDGVGLRTPDSTLWIAYTIDSVCASRYGCARAQSAHAGPEEDKTKHAGRLSP